MSEYRELLLGCGHARDKRIVPVRIDPKQREWQNLITLDHNPTCKPDLMGDLDTIYRFSFACRTNYTYEFLSTIADEVYPDETVNNWFFKESIFDEVHAYETLEHLGHLGDAFAFFAHFSEIWRILKPDGYLCATVPSRYSPWLWGDPSHRRLINEESLSFLDQDNYAQLDGPRPTMMSDFRHIYKADFKVIERQDNHKLFYFILQAVKPSRVRDRIP